MRADHLCPLRLIGEELVHLGHRSIKRHDRKAVIVHVQNQILAHHCQPDYRDITFSFHISLSN
jgi:hypothetical protein